MADMSAADFAALTNDNGGFGNGNSWAWIIVLLLIFGGGAFGFGGNQGALTRAEMNQGFNDNDVNRKLDNIDGGLAQIGYTNLANSKDLQASLANCCCETNRNIDAIRYENAKNTCEIVRAIEKDGDATRQLITHNEMQALRDQLQTTRFQLSQQAQSANLIDTLRPVPIPAYPTCSPYQAANYFGGYGCGGCGGY